MRDDRTTCPPPQDERAAADRRGASPSPLLYVPQQAYEVPALVVESTTRERSIRYANASLVFPPGQTSSRSRRRGRCEESPDLLHGVVDLHVECHLAERRARTARVAGDPVVDTRRRARSARCGAAPARRRDRIAYSRADQFFTDPGITAEVQHFRCVGNAGV